MEKREKFWDQQAGEFDKNFKRDDPGFIRTVESTLALLTQDEVVLDFGCATGEYSLAIAPRVARLHGIDLSGEMIEIARQKARLQQADNLRFSRADLFSPGLESSYTAILAFNVLHLADDLPGVLARLNALLPVGGLLVSLTPCLRERGWLFKSLIGLAQTIGYAPPIHSFSGAELEAMIVDSQFEILSSETWDRKNAVRRIAARKK